MGSVFRKTFTKPLPKGAETFNRNGQRFARWKNAKGKKQTAEVTTGKGGLERIIRKAGTYTAKYRDGSGVVVEKATGCRDETAARSMLADLERRAELVKANVLTAAEDAISDHQDMPLGEHIAAFGEHSTANRVSKTYLEDSLRYLRRLAAECTFSKLSDLDRSALERRLVRRTDEGMSARTCNAYRSAMVRFCN